jgi:hypothetical protein
LGRLQPAGDDRYEGYDRDISSRDRGTMIAEARKSTGELEFQGAVLQWLNDVLRRRPGLNLDRVTQEKPRKMSSKRNDLVVWKDRAAEGAFLAIELKTPATPIHDPQLFADAVEKAQFWKAPYFALWNMQEAELYKTPPKRHRPYHARRLARLSRRARDDDRGGSGPLAT